MRAENGLPPEPEHTRALLQRTHGWAAGLRLSLAVRPDEAARREAQATQRHLFDYLAAEVFEDMPAPLQEFLLHCSVLPELTAERCAQVSGEAQAARLLDEVERRGLFVSVLDAPVLTLRLHDLFRDFLEDRLQRRQPEAVPGLLRRAAAHEPDLARAVGYLARAGAWDEAVALLAQRGSGLAGRGRRAGAGADAGPVPAFRIRAPARSADAARAAGLRPLRLGHAVRRGAACGRRLRARRAPPRRGGGARLRLVRHAPRRAQGGSHPRAEAVACARRWTTPRAR